MSKIVLLYNDKDIAVVRQIRRELKERWPDVEFWIADEGLTAKDDLTTGIRNAIETASGVVIFFGTSGFGRFQERIEIPAVDIATWLRKIDRVLVHLAPGLLPPESLASIVPVNRDGAVGGNDPSRLAVLIAEKFAFSKAGASEVQPAAEKIVFLHHPTHRVDARRLQASLRRKIDDKKYVLYSQDNLSSFGDAPDRLLNAVTQAWAVFVVVGANGPGDELRQLAQGAAKQVLADQGGKERRHTVLLRGVAAPADILPGWPSIAAPDPLDFDGVAEDMLEGLHLEPPWTLEVAIKTAVAQVGEANVAQKKLSDVARSLTEGKPLTLMLGPYAVPDIDSCPSKVRQALLDLLRDQPLYKSLVGDAPALKSDFVPVLWTDHLATLCLLAQCDRDKIATTISDVVSAHDGDEYGEPAPLFREVADFVKKFQSYGPVRSPALPAITIITVCPGLRMERALVSRGIDFERVTMLFGTEGWRELHHKIYRPGEDQKTKAEEGESDYMPQAQDRQQIDEQNVQFVRLIKLGGSRDLPGSIAVDFGQTYRMLAEFQTRLEPLVSAAGIGPYLALGAGLATPPLQAAHALLLRTALQKPDRRPQLALIGNSAKLPDPLWQAEVEHLANLTQTQQSGFDRIEVVEGAPEVFIEALGVAFSGAPGRTGP